DWGVNACPPLCVGIGLGTCAATSSMLSNKALLRPLGTRRPRSAKSLLLIGNSFTYYYGEPFILQEIAFSQGLQLDICASLKGGQTYRQHCGLQMTRQTCAKGGYQYAIIQGQSQEPAQFARDRAGCRDVLVSYLELCAMVREASPQCHIYVENTWAYGAVNAGGFDTLENFGAMLEEGSKALATAAATDRTLVGQAFAAASRAGFAPSLLDTDDKHPSLAGAYLKACVSYLTISGRRFKGRVPSCGLAEEDAAALRRIAESVVLG
ncbi:MAG: fumarate hydratase, partial [Bacteroidales bacterium]|nr:fumarate hydratase [Bacteroidales bacterium]